MLVPYEDDGESKIQKWVEKSEEDILKEIEVVLIRDCARARTDPKWKVRAIKRAYRIFLKLILEIRQAEPPDLH